MTDCGCDKARAELEEYLHRELSDEDFRDVAEHLENCPDCTSEHLVGMTLTLKMQRACREKAPDDVKAAVLAAIDGVSAA